MTEKKQRRTKSKRQFDLSIVIPAYREETRIGKTLDGLAHLLDTDLLLKGLETEVIVVAADANDKTDEEVLKRKLNFKNYRLLKPGPQVGKGRDVQFGMLRAKGEAVLFMDADLATPLTYLPHFYRKFQDGADVVIATRNLRKHHPQRLRRYISYTGNILFRVAGGLWVEDSQCGFKLFSYEAAQVCFSRLSIMGWGFDMEILAIARANGLTIISQRVNDWRSVENGTFNNGVLANSIIAIGDLYHILTKRIARKYRA